MRNPAAMDLTATSDAAEVSDTIYLSIQRFLYLEAELLDRRDYRGWLSLLTDDVTYRVSAQVHHDANAGPLAYAVIDENAQRLKARVEQIANSKLTHAENPPTLTRRFVSNLRATDTGRDDEYKAVSNILIYRTRPDMQDGALYAGERVDTLRRLNGALRIARRDVQLDQSLFHGSMSTLF